MTVANNDSPETNKKPMTKYFNPTDSLRRTDVIDFDDPAIAELAKQFKDESENDTDLVCRTYEFVRDQIAHSADIHGKVVTCKASEVLEAKEGTCFSKSHLLAALLRANGVHAAFCYQRIRMGDTSDSPFVLHGLNVVCLREHRRWIRLDARGNTDGINAQFSIEEEKIAYTPRTDLGERSYPSKPNPAPSVIELLQRCETLEELWENLPQGLPELEPPEEMILAAQHGDPESAYQLGKSYLNDLLDYEQAFHWMNRAVELGSDDAIDGLGVCYLSGIGVEQNDEKAAELFQKAKEKNVIKGFFNLGQCYYFGCGVKKNVKKAIQLLQHAADAGLPDAVDLLASIYLNDESWRNRKKAFQYLLSAQSTHDPDILYQLAVCYQNGYGTKRNDAEAVRVLQLVYSPDMTYLLGWCYLHGRGVEKDVKRANELFCVAATAGCGSAQYEWGCSLQSGRGTDKNQEKGVQWLVLAAEQDYPWDREAEKSWRFVHFAMCCLCCWWIAIPVLGAKFAMDFVQKLNAGQVSAKEISMGISYIFLLTGPITYWLGIFCSLRLARWGCVLMLISGIEFTLEMGRSWVGQPGAMTFNDIFPVLFLLAAPAAGAIGGCVLTAKRTYWLELKRNKREISFRFPILLCCGVYIVSLLVRWVLAL